MDNPQMQITTEQILAKVGILSVEIDMLRLELLKLQQENTELKKGKNTADIEER